MSRISCVVLLLGLVVILAAPTLEGADASLEQAEDCSSGPIRCWKILEPEKILYFELVVPAVPDRVWAASRLGRSLRR